jgi:hypothetical protein
LTGQKTIEEIDKLVTDRDEKIDGRIGGAIERPQEI